MGYVRTWVRSLLAENQVCGLLVLLAVSLSSPTSAQGVKIPEPVFNATAAREFPQVIFDKITAKITYQTTFQQIGPEGLVRWWTRTIKLVDFVKAPSRTYPDTYLYAMRLQKYRSPERARGRLPSTLPALCRALIGDAKTAEAFAAMIETLPYHPLRGTSIGSAIECAHQLLDDVPYSPLRRVVDISGDGKSMQEPRLASARLAALNAGITINGLPISDDRDSDLADFYSHSVIGGPGAFLVLADGFTSFDQAIHQKLVLEIADTTPGVAIRLARY